MLGSILCLIDGLNEPHWRLAALFQIYYHPSAKLDLSFSIGHFCDVGAEIKKNVWDVILFLSFNRGCFCNMEQIQPQPNNESKTFLVKVDKFYMTYIIAGFAICTHNRDKSIDLILR